MRQGLQGNTGNRRHGQSYRRKSAAFSFGFGLGLLIAIPTALSLAEWVGTAPPPQTMIHVVAKDAIVDSVVHFATNQARNGDVATARSMLTAHESGSTAHAVFALAETYDPNMLAAWNIRGVTADARLARELYRKAASLGLARAERRLGLLEN
jgi:TPR repeat protein